MNDQQAPHTLEISLPLEDWLTLRNVLEFDDYDSDDVRAIVEKIDFPSYMLPGG
jgi:hypothetical protein